MDTHAPELEHTAEGQSKTPIKLGCQLSCETPCHKRGKISGFFHRMACHIKEMVLNFGRRQPKIGRWEEHPAETAPASRANP